MINMMLYQTLAFILHGSIKKHLTLTDNPPIRIYVNKIKNRIAFIILKVYYLELLTPETMKLLGRTRNKITKNENGETHWSSINSR